LTLGAMPGAMLKFFDFRGNALASGEIISFNILTMVKFGLVALLISFGVYLLWDIIFKNVRKFKVVSIIKGLKK
jgi:hypothetical protein